MGSGFQFIDIIILAMIAGFVALRLRSVLGRRTGDESTHRPESVPRSRGGQASETRAEAAESVPSDVVVRLEADPAIRKALREMRRHEADFDVETFIEGARAIYPMILEAFWQGDRETLEKFLSEDVAGRFIAAIDAREAANHEIEARVVELSEPAIHDAGVDGRTATITVAYTAELVSVTRDAEGHVIDGNETDTVEVRDIWTFERRLGSDDPNWVLVATRSE